MDRDSNYYTKMKIRVLLVMLAAFVGYIMGEAIVRLMIPDGLMEMVVHVCGVAIGGAVGIPCSIYATNGDKWNSK